MQTASERRQLSVSTTYEVYSRDVRTHSGEALAAVRTGKPPEEILQVFTEFRTSVDVAEKKMYISGWLACTTSALALPRLASVLVLVQRCR